MLASAGREIAFWRLGRDRRCPLHPPPSFLNPALMVKKEEEEEVINYSSQRPLFVFFGQESCRLPLFSRVVFFSFVSWRTLLSVPFRFQTFRACSRASAFSENKSRCSCVPRAEKARHVYVNGVAFGTHERALSTSSFFVCFTPEAVGSEGCSC